MGFSHVINTLFPEVIEYREIGKKIIIVKHNRPGIVIKKGSKLRVRKDQSAVFLKDEKIIDILRPGTYFIYPEILTSLSRIKSFKPGFRSPVHADLYYLNQRSFVNNPWSNKNPVSFNDKDFKYVQVRAFGTFSFKIVSPEQFMSEVFLKMRKFFTCNILLYISSFVAESTEMCIFESGMSVIDLIKDFKSIEKNIMLKLEDVQENIGIEYFDVKINNISIPAIVQQMIEDRMWKEIESRYSDM